LDLVSLSDPALDMTREEKDAFIQSHFDKKLLKTKPGQSPVVFEVQPADVVFAMGNLSNSELASVRMLAFRACCRSITLRDGRVLRPRLEDAGPAQIATEDWLRVAGTAVGAYRVLEIGMRACSLSNLLPEAIDPLSLPGGPAPTS
jgi:hypothetical protein